MNFKNIIKRSFIAILLCGHALATDMNEHEDLQLIAGTRSSGSNLQEFNNLNSAGPLEGSQARTTVSEGNDQAAVKFPSLNQIKERLLQGNSTVVNERGEVFKINSSWGPTSWSLSGMPDFEIEIVPGNYPIKRILNVHFTDGRKTKFFLKKI